MTQPEKSDSLERCIQLAHKIHRRIAPANVGPLEAVGTTRSERSDVLDTAELVVRIEGRPFLVEIRELNL